MAGFLELIVSNAASALVLAILALVVTRVARRPALVHGLWLLVLVKLVTPPVIPLHLTQPDWIAGLSREASPPASTRAVGVLPQLLPGVEPAEITWAPAETRSPGHAGPTSERPAMRARAAGELAAPAALSEISLGTLLAGTLLLGSTLTLLLTCHRVRAFNRALRGAGTPSPQLLEEVRAVGRRLGVRHAPAVLLVPGRISPMLWSGLGRARLILPEDLVAGLDAQERRTLIAHELAHFRRGDHLVRLLELAATLLYWWCPLLYLARRMLRQAEEECCDAWVLWAEPGEVRSYAGALLQTLDFLSPRGRLLPPTASGINGGRFLRRRVEMIMNARTPRGAGVIGRSLLVLLAALALPLVPAWAQDPERTVEKVPQEKPATGRTRTQDEKLERLEERLRRLERKNEELLREQRRRDARNDRESQGKWRRAERAEARRQAEARRSFEEAMRRADERKPLEGWVKGEALEVEGRKAEAKDLLEAVNRRLAEQYRSQKARAGTLNALKRAEERIVELERKLGATRKVGDLDAAARLESALADSKAELDRARAEREAMFAHQRALELERKNLEVTLRRREVEAADVLAAEQQRLEARRQALQAERQALAEQARRTGLHDPRGSRPKPKPRPKRPMSRQKRIQVLENRLESMKVEMEAMLQELQELRSEEQAERKERRSLKL